MRVTKIVTIMAGLALMGAAIEFMKDYHGPLADTRYALGNVSTFWLLFSFLPALRSTSLVRGAITGLTGVMSALVGFYVAEAFVFPDAWGQGGIRAGIIACLHGGSRWMMLGLVSGPVMGAIAAWVGQKLAPVWGWAIAAALFIGEPLICYGIRGQSLPIIGGSWWYHWNAVSSAEIIAGLACAAIFLRRETSQTRM